jgi:hypothetical protein
MWVVAQFSFHANRGPLLAPLGRFLVVAAIVALINFAQIADSQNIDHRYTEAPTPNEAGELMQWLTRHLDVCSPLSHASPPPSCRCRFAYWFWDDPATSYAPDRLYLLGGISGSAAQCDNVTISSEAQILNDFWQLSWVPSSLAETNSSWAFEWKCLEGCEGSVPSTTCMPGSRADAAVWVFGGSDSYSESPEVVSPEVVPQGNNPKDQGDDDDDDDDDDDQGEDEDNQNGFTKLSNAVASKSHRRSKSVASPLPPTTAVGPVVSSLFLYGGYGAGSNTSVGAPRGYYNDVWRYDVLMGTWGRVHGRSEPFRTLAEFQLSTPLTSASAAALDTCRAQSANQAEMVQVKAGVARESEKTDAPTADPESMTPSLWLAPLSGASAYLRQASANGAWPATVVVAGGQGFEIGSNTTFFLDAVRYNASRVIPSNPPRVRVGALLYAPLWGVIAIAQYGGFNQQSSSLFDLQALGLYTGTWSFICDSSFCADHTDIAWCQTCLNLMPTDDYVNGLRFASWLVTNTSSGPSRVIIGGRTRASPQSNLWFPAPWTVARGTALPRPILPSTFCSQPNPSPTRPSDFQCIGDTWRATNLCLHCATALNLTNGEPIQILGDWAPSSLTLTLQPGSLLNVSGSLSLLNLTADMPINDENFEALARAATGRISVLEAATVSCPSILAGTPNVSAVGRSFIDGCTKSTFFSSSWSPGRTLSDRRTVDIILNWKIEIMPECAEPEPLKQFKGRSLPLIVSLSVIAVFLLALAAIFIFIRFDRLKSFFTGISTSYFGKSSDTSSQKSEIDEESGSGKHVAVQLSNHISYNTSPSIVHTSEAPALLESQSLNGTVIKNARAIHVVDYLSPRTILSNPTKPLVSDSDRHQPVPNPRDSIALGCTPRSGVSRSDLDYESGLGSLETSVQNEFEDDDDQFIPDLSMV